MKMRPIEMYRMFPSGTWDTVIVDIPADTQEKHIPDVAVQAAGEIYGSDGSAFSVYNTMEDWEDEEEEEEVVSKRSEIVVKLSFDMGQTTVGTAEQQQEAAIEQINMTLARDPYGLGAILEKADNSS